MTARMPGAPPRHDARLQRPPGPDCPDIGETPRQVRRKLKRDLHREIATEEGQ